MTSEMIAVAIFAGGQSQRMGQDKALLKIGDETLLERGAKNALQVSSRVYVVGRSAPENWPFSPVVFLPDDTPQQGPLGGLQTILKRENLVLAIGCDLPKMSADGLRWLLEIFCHSEEGSPTEESRRPRGILQSRAPSGQVLPQNDSNLMGLVVENAEQWEPLFSIYTSKCLPLIEENLRDERRSLHALIKRGEFNFVKAPPEIQRQLVNVNTPEEWSAIQS